MISKAKLIQSIGKFYNCTIGADWFRLAQAHTFLFEPHAYCKSTLGNVFRALRDHDPNMISARKVLGTTTPKAVTVLLDSTLKPKLFVSGGPYHGDIIDAMPNKHMLGGLLPLI
jgi:hypothetical protein